MEDFKKIEKIFRKEGLGKLLEYLASLEEVVPSGTRCFVAGLILGPDHTEEQVDLFLSFFDLPSFEEACRLDMVARSSIRPYGRP